MYIFTNHEILDYFKAARKYQKGFKKDQKNLFLGR